MKAMKILTTKTTRSNYSTSNSNNVIRRIGCNSASSRSIKKSLNNRRKEKVSRSSLPFLFLNMLFLLSMIQKISSRTSVTVMGFSPSSPSSNRLMRPFRTRTTATSAATTRGNSNSGNDMIINGFAGRWLWEHQNHCRHSYHRRTSTTTTSTQLFMARRKSSSSSTSFVRQRSLVVYGPDHFQYEKPKDDIYLDDVDRMINFSTKKRPYKLVIVESPGKCQTIYNILQQHLVDAHSLEYDFVVTSCMGHVRDLTHDSSTNDSSKTKSLVAGIQMVQSSSSSSKGKHDDNDSNDSNSSTNIYQPIYEIVPHQRSLVKELQVLSNSAQSIILATDDDREGEAMAWHLLEVLLSKKEQKIKQKSDNDHDDDNNNTKKWHRIRFGEITPKAIVSSVSSILSLPSKVDENDSNGNNSKNNDDDDDDRIIPAHPRHHHDDLNYNLVQAQETRRMLDRLAGFTVSPILWRKISPGLSAGRVQSVGMALIVQRERQRLLFEPTEYWNIHASFVVPSSSTTSTSPANADTSNIETSTSSESSILEGKLVSMQDDTGATIPIASSGSIDFEGRPANTLRPNSKHKYHLQEETVHRMVSSINRTNTDVFTDWNWSIGDIASTIKRFQPPAPYQTSSLQQDANRKLGLSVTQTMQCAQQLYEEGYITYMRTDSNQITSDDALQAIRGEISRLFDPGMYQYRTFEGKKKQKSKKKKNNNNKKKSQDDGNEEAAEGAAAAHEAIRPSVKEGSSSSSPYYFAHPSTLQTHPKFSSATVRLYEMIYQRSLAAYMTPSISNQTSVEIWGRNHDHDKEQENLSGIDMGRSLQLISNQNGGDDGDKNDESNRKDLNIVSLLFKASGSVVVDPGYNRIYDRSLMVSSQDSTNPVDDDNDEKNRNDNNVKNTNLLRQSNEGATASAASAASDSSLSIRDVQPIKSTTQPPARYTEASLVQELETLGVGRPSTYASTVQILRDRAYVLSGTDDKNGGGGGRRRRPSSGRDTSPRGNAISAHRAAGTSANGSSSSNSNARGPMVPSLSAFVVCTLLEEHCSMYVDPSFTAQMEERLDRIANADSLFPTNDIDNDSDDEDDELNDDDGMVIHTMEDSSYRNQYLDEFYSGPNGLAAKIAAIDKNVVADEARQVRLPSLAISTPKEEEGEEEEGIINTSNKAKKSSYNVGLFIGPWGPYIKKLSSATADDGSEDDDDDDDEEDDVDEKTNKKKKVTSAPLPTHMAMDLSTITMENLKAVFEAKEVMKTGGGILLGTHPTDGKTIRYKVGRFGAYLQRGDDDDDDMTTHTIPEHLRHVMIQDIGSVDDDDADDDGIDSDQTSLYERIGLSFEEAVQYVDLPKTLCLLEEKPITAHLGPYGPYLKYNNKSLSLSPADGDILTLSVENATALVTERIIEGKRSSGSRSGQKNVLAEIGEMEDNMVTVKSGRFGPYINWQKVNAKLPTEYMVNPKDLPLEEAWSLITAKIEQQGSSGSSSSSGRKKKGRKGSTSKSSNKTNLPPPPKRPSTAYLFFCSEKREQIKQGTLLLDESSSSSSSSMSVGEMSKALAKLWSETSEEDRQPYMDMAETAKEEYRIKKEEWLLECQKLENGDGSSSSSPTSKTTKIKPKKSTSTGRKIINVTTRESGRTKSSTTKGTASTNNTTAGGPKRPKSAYIFYCAAKRDEVAKTCSTLGETSKELGRLWKETSEEERQIYVDMSNQDKLRYEREKEEMLLLSSTT